MNFRAAVHPFPARMAPELVQQQLDGIKGSEIVLDPMMGSGSFVLAAARHGHRAIGVDSDPLAHVIARAAAGCYGRDRALKEASRIVDRIHRGWSGSPAFDAETDRFIDFWFDGEARERLGSLAASIEEVSDELKAPLWCAFSRLIITKNSGASRARDVSHSRPHRVRATASFDPVERFINSVETVLKRAATDIPSGAIFTVRGDARSLPLPDACVNGIMTSPPYLTAIDYLRGHRMSLVWMGYSVNELRDLRGENIGSERGADAFEKYSHIASNAIFGALPDRRVRTINRYVNDLGRVVAELARVLRRRGSIAFVVANSMHSDVSVSAELIIAHLAESQRLRLVSRFERELPASRRYLPPPTKGKRSLDKRMHTEVILKFVKP